MPFDGVDHQRTAIEGRERDLDAGDVFEIDALDVFDWNPKRRHRMIGATGNETSDHEKNVRFR